MLKRDPPRADTSRRRAFAGIWNAAPSESPFSTTSERSGVSNEATFSRIQIGIPSSLTLSSPPRRLSVRFRTDDQSIISDRWMLFLYNGSMNITFQDGPPIDPMDGDYLCFMAIVDGAPVTCHVTFDVLCPTSNSIETMKTSFWKKKEQIHAAARSLIEAGKVESGQILITRLELEPPAPPVS